MIIDVLYSSCCAAKPLSSTDLYGLYLKCLELIIEIQKICTYERRERGREREMGERETL